MINFVRSLELKIFLDFLDSIELETNKKNKKMLLDTQRSLIFG